MEMAKTNYLLRLDYIIWAAAHIVRESILSSINSLVGAYGFRPRMYQQPGRVGSTNSLHLTEMVRLNFWGLSPPFHFSLQGRLCIRHLSREFLLSLISLILRRLILVTLSLRLHIHPRAA